MAYLNSSKIKVYPSGYRGNGINSESFVNSEQNLNEIASRLTSEDSYIAHENGVDIEFVIKGYLFKASKSDITGLVTNPSEGTIIYASATVDEATPEIVGDTYKTLVPYGTSSVGILDDSNEFKGVNFDTTSGDLSLYKYESGWKVIEDSMMVFSTKRVKDRNEKCINDEFTTTKLNVTGSASDVTLPDSSINTNEIADRAITKEKLNEDVFSSIYPIGSIYISVNSNNPSDYFGGTWEQIKDTFLLSAGDTYSAGTSGGKDSSTFTLTEDNLPQHRHSYSGTTNSKYVDVGNQKGGANTGYDDSSHYHKFSVSILKAGIWGGSDTSYMVWSSGSTTSYEIDETYSNTGSHRHYVTITTGSKNLEFGKQSYSGNTGYQKASSSVTSIKVPTMPPYLVVYMWKRTA